MNQSQEFYSMSEHDAENLDTEKEKVEENDDIEIEDKDSLKNIKFKNHYSNNSQDEQDDSSLINQNDSKNNKSRLREIMSYLKGQKTGLRISELNKIFEKLDQDGDRKIDTNEIKQFLSTLRTPINDYFIQKLFKDFDLDNDGEIKKSEFMERMRTQKERGYGNELTELLEVFKLFDANQDNKICIDDLQNVMNALGENFESDTIKDMMKYLSSSNGYIDFSRFFDLVKDEGKKDMYH